VNGASLAAPAILIAGSALLVLLVVVSGTQVFTSSRRAKDHLANATALAPLARSAPAGPASVSDPRRAIPGGTAAGGDDSSQQIFAQLTQYYAANISQGQTILGASFLSMVIGFAVVFAGIVTAGVNSTTAIVAGVAGVLSQFIAATFLVALRSTQAQSTTYAQTLVELRLRDLRAADDAQSVSLGLRLLEDISGDGAAALVNQTRAALAMGLIVKGPAPAETPAPISVDIDKFATRPTARANTNVSTRNARSYAARSRIAKASASSSYDRRRAA